MPQHRKYDSPAARQAAYHKRTEQAKQEQLSAKGLPTVPAIPTIPGYPRWRRAIEQTRFMLELVHTEMEDYAQERSEQWQETERADIFRQKIDDVEQIRELINELEL